MEIYKKERFITDVGAYEKNGNNNVVLNYETGQEVKPLFLDPGKTFNLLGFDPNIYKDLKQLRKDISELRGKILVETLDVTVKNLTNLEENEEEEKQGDLPI